MEYKLSEQELKDLMLRSWLKAKKFYSGKTDEYFYDHFESEKKQLLLQVASQHRELLLAYEEYRHGDLYNLNDGYEDVIERFLTNNYS